MEKEINERLDNFITMFTSVIKEHLDDYDSKKVPESEFYNTIGPQDKRYFLINDENFDDIMVEIIETMKYNIEHTNKVNIIKEFIELFTSFKKMIASSTEITKQINDRYSEFNSNSQGMQIEEPSEDEKECDFDDEVEFSKIYSNKPRGFKNTKGSNQVNVSVYPENYGFSSLFIDPLANKLAVLEKLKGLETKFEKFLMEKGYFDSGNSSLIKDTYRIGRVINFDSVVSADDYKNVVFEELKNDQLKNIQISFENIDNYVIYSGQCVVIRTATQNGKIEVKEILNEVSVGYEINSNKIEEENVTQFIDDCNVLIAKGPFFNPDKYDFKLAISKLKACVTKSNANVLIVKGPIVSYKFKKSVETSYEDAKNTFISMLIDIPAANIIYVNEATEKTNISFLPINPLESYGRIIQAPNPCVISIGGFRFGLSDERLVDELTSNSIVLNKENKFKKMDLALKAIHDSKTLLPLYNTNIYCDWSKYKHFELDQQVDVFVVHSNKFEPTVVKMDSTQYVNLKSFSKPSSFGSYACIKLAGEGKVYTELFECEESEDN